jgi:hypothetical protein
MISSRIWAHVTTLQCLDLPLSQIVYLEKHHKDFCGHWLFKRSFLEINQ